MGQTEQINEVEVIEEGKPIDEQMREMMDGEVVEEEPEKQEDEGSESKPEPGVYTEDEFNELDPFEVDPAKLSGGGASVHKRYMQIYREQILPELEQLRAFKQQVMENVRAEEARRDPRQEFLNEVRGRAMRSLGVQELDDLNPEHLVELSRQSAILQNEIQARDGAERGRQESVRRVEALKISLREEIPEFEALDRFAKSDLDNLPYAKAQKVIVDLQSGDPARIRAVYKMFGERFAASKKKPAGAPQGVPTKVIRSSSGVPEPKRVDYESFAGASADEQARMLIEMGLVEEEN